jgi:SAM-dependent methyltransferase
MLQELNKLAKGNRFLDFGVGGNLRSISIAKSESPKNDYWACDLYPHPNPNYFTTYDTTHFGKFDGISSYAVIEHLTAPIPSWQYMNRLLRPCSQGGGIMVHSFPSQYHHRISDWQILIRSHTCLFSRRSLPLTLAKSGFKLLNCDPPRPVGAHSHPIFVFKKVQDI